MEIKQEVTGIVTIIVAIILVATVMAPVIGSVSGSGSDGVTRTYENDGPYFALVGDDGTVHTLNISQDGNSFVVTTDGVETRELGMYVPQSTGVAPAIGIGVYEAYNNGGVLVSQSGRSPTVSQTIDTFRTQALAGNTDVTEGTYQLWNFYQYTLMKIMGLTVMSNTDSQYMMGDGITSGSNKNTGTTSSAYQKSTSSTTAESLFIENGWGNVNEFVGDVSFSNRVMSAGNTLGGNVIASVEGVNTTSVTLPSSNNFILTMSMASDTFGVPLTSGTNTTAGIGINDYIYSNTGNNLLSVGGAWIAGSGAGLSRFSANNGLGLSNDYIGSRLAYVMTGAGAAPTVDYGYIITFDITSGQTVITDVQVQDGGSLISTMPTGTTLNPFWDFDSATGIGPFGSYYAAINLSNGANTDDSTETRLSTQKGEIGYILNPNNLKQTMAGTTFDPTLYNVMVIIPTAYWYSDPATNKLYIGSSADMFEGITMIPYAHSYTIDPDVDTGNPPQQVTYASTSIIMGEDSIVRLYANGEVKLISTDGTVNMGVVSDGSDVSFTITDDVLTYGGNTRTGMLSYVSNEGDMVYAHNPIVTDDSRIIIGGITNGLETTGSETVTIGYALDTEYGELESATVTVLDPVSSGTATYESTEMSVNSTEVGENAYRIDSILFTSSWSDGSTSTATYTYFLAPAIVTVESEGEGGVGTVLSVLLSLIPLVTILGIIIATVGWYKYKTQ